MISSTDITKNTYDTVILKSEYSEQNSNFFAATQDTPIMTLSDFSDIKSFNHAIENSEISDNIVEIIQKYAKSIKELIAPIDVQQISTNNKSLSNFFEKINNKCINCKSITIMPIIPSKDYKNPAIDLFLQELCLLYSFDLSESIAIQQNENSEIEVRSETLNVNIQTIPHVEDIISAIESITDEEDTISNLSEDPFDFSDQFDFAIMQNGIEDTKDEIVVPENIPQIAVYIQTVPEEPKQKDAPADQKEEEKEEKFDLSKAPTPILEPKKEAKNISLIFKGISSFFEKFKTSKKNENPKELKKQDSFEQLRSRSRSMGQNSQTAKPSTWFGTISLSEYDASKFKEL